MMEKRSILIALLIYCPIVILLFIIYQLTSPSIISQLDLISQQSPPALSSFPSTTPISITELTLDAIFSGDHAWADKLLKNETITIITTGDVIPARTVNLKMTEYNDFSYSFKKTVQFLKTADIVLINLETPLIKDCPASSEGMVFCGNQRFIEGLKLANINVVNLANNHILNYGIYGIETTNNLLKENNILPCGHPTNHLAIKSINQKIVGFLGWNLLSGFNQETILTTIRQAANRVDLLIVSFHWGVEYTNYPTHWQIDLAHKAVDNGADLIVGNHPHWIQPIEIYNKKLIIYAHGNFIFDQEWSKETKTGFIGKHIFYENKLIDSQLVPIRIIDFSQPQILTGQAEIEALDHLKNISYQLIKQGSTLERPKAEP